MNMCSIDNHRPYSNLCSLLVPLIHIGVTLTQVKASDWRRPRLPQYLVTFGQFCNFLPSILEMLNGKGTKVLWVSHKRPSGRELLSCIGTAEPTEQACIFTEALCHDPLFTLASSNFPVKPWGIYSTFDACT